MRAVLGDLTNLPLKRDFSLISTDFEAKSRDFPSKKALFEHENSRFASLQVDNDDHQKGLIEDEQSFKSSDTETDVDNSTSENENKGSCNLIEGSVNLLKNVEVSRDNCGSYGSVPAKFWTFKEKNDGDKDFDVGYLGCGSQSEVVECSKMPNSQGSRGFELERCTALEGDDCGNLNSGADLLKSCSCSFCLKAAYIWSDLHYQDIKGRIAALKKSQKEASILVNKYGRGHHVQGSSNKSSKLESDLTANWRSLSHHMEDIFLHESNHLQDGFAALKEMRENCKMDLGKINESPSCE